MTGRSSDTPLVSVIIPARNRASYIPAVLKSVFAQTHPNLEVIVVDDASTDDTADVARSYADRGVICLSLPSSRGCGGARNAGIEIAKGKYLAFIDTDDEWLPTKIEKQVALAEAGAKIVYCGALNVTSSGDVISELRPRHRGRITRALLEENVICGSASAILMHRECLDGVQPFLSHVLSEDWDLWLRLSLRYEFDFVPQTLVKIAVTPGSLLRSMTPEAYRAALQQIYDNVAADPASAETLHLQARAFRSGIDYATAMQFLTTGATAQSLHYLFKSLAGRPLQLRVYRALLMILLGPKIVGVVKTIRTALHARRARSLVRQ